MNLSHDAGVRRGRAINGSKVQVVSPGSAKERVKDKGGSVPGL
jgi:hypothetical protein